MTRFTSICKMHKAFRRLRSITLAVHIETPLQTWMKDVTELLSTAPLEILQIYATTTFVKEAITDNFWKTVVTMHGSRLKRFSIHRMKISLDAISDICSRCHVLEQLFVVADRDDLVRALCFPPCNLRRSSKSVRMTWHDVFLLLQTSVRFMSNSFLERMQR